VICLPWGVLPGRKKVNRLFLLWKRETNLFAMRGQLGKKGEPAFLERKKTPVKEFRKAHNPPKEGGERYRQKLAKKR